MVSQPLSGEAAIPERPAIVNMYSVEHDNYNKTLLRVRPSKMDTNSMLALYRELAAVKTFLTSQLMAIIPDGILAQMPMFIFQISGGGHLQDICKLWFHDR